MRSSRRWAVAGAVTTIEGWAPRRCGAKAKVALQVAQCGYCQSGQIMTAASFLQANPTRATGTSTTYGRQPVPLRHLPCIRAAVKRRPKT